MDTKLKNKGNGATEKVSAAGQKAGCRHKSWDQCPVMRALDLIANKWTVPVIYNLYCAGAPVRFGELQRRIETITQKELTKRLRELEKAGLIERRVYAEVPPRVEYKLTQIGRTLVEPLGALGDWARKYSEVIDANRRRAAAALPRPHAVSAPVM
jgi:DNA-binding HxlR family transcriptional regulator